MRQENVEYGISELARSAGISSRTLRHYHSLGLLFPARTAPNGYRFYGGDELVRLQRILLLRELGLGLEAIAEILDGQQDTTQALRVHLRWLEAERRRLTNMSRSVAATISALEQGETMEAKDMYSGFEAIHYEAEARSRWGNAAIDESIIRRKNLGDEGIGALMAEHEGIADDLAQCREALLPVDSPGTQKVVGRHHAWVSLSWTPGREAYIGLGDMYVADARFRAAYDAPAGRPARAGLAAYLCAAMAHYARENLT